MIAPQIRQRPAGTGREVDTAKRFAGESYHGVTLSSVTRSARDPLTVAGELYAAAECLADLAEDFAAGAYDNLALSNADSLLTGCGRVVCELRQRKEARQ